MISIERQYQDEIDNLKSVLHEVRHLIEGYVDVIDGDYGVPAPNKAMKAVQIIDDAIVERTCQVNSQSFC